MLHPGGLDYRFDFGLVWRSLVYWPAIKREERLLASPGLTRPEVLKLQRRRLESLLVHACETVPFYRDRFAEAARRHGGVEKCPLEELPPLLKGEALANREQMRSSRPRIAFRRHSSGTTGEPLFFLRDLYAQSHFHLLVRDLLTEHWPRLGLRFNPRRKVAFVKLDKPGSNPYSRRGFTFLPAMGFIEHLYIAFQDERFLMERLAEFLKREPLEIVFGEPTVLYLYGLALKKHGYPRHPGPVKAVVTSGSQVLPANRKELEDFFQAPVIDQYSISEIGTVGLETPGRPGFLCKDTTFILEVLDEKLRPVSPGERGLIALTALNAYTMPFIRYVPGDVGRLAPEPEGPFLRLESLEGRVNELFALKNGGLLHPYMFLDLMDRFPVGRYQIIQETLDRLVFRTESGLETELRTQLREALRKVMGNGDLAVDFEKSPFDYSHKFRAFHSKVPNPYKDLLRAPRA